MPLAYAHHSILVILDNDVGKMGISSQSKLVITRNFRAIRIPRPSSYM